jgi:SHS2 domain-containing protein
MDRYRILSHTADTAIETEATSIDGLVEKHAFGMLDLMLRST